MKFAAQPQKSRTWLWHFYGHGFSYMTIPMPIRKHGGLTLGKATCDPNVAANPAPVSAKVYRGVWSDMHAAAAINKPKRICRTPLNALLKAFWQRGMSRLNTSSAVRAGRTISRGHRGVSLAVASTPAVLEGTLPHAACPVGSQAITGDFPASNFQRDRTTRIGAELMPIASKRSRPMRSASRSISSNLVAILGMTSPSYARHGNSCNDVSLEFLTTKIRRHELSVENPAISRRAESTYERPTSAETTAIIATRRVLIVVANL